MRSRRGEGSTAQKLINLLEIEGFTNITLIPAAGAWCSNIHFDVYRWEGHGFTKDRKGMKDETEVTFHSWDIMTKCINGIEIEEFDGIFTSFEVYAKPSKKL